MNIRFINSSELYKSTIEKIEIGDICLIKIEDTIYIWLHYRNNVTIDKCKIKIQTCYSFKTTFNAEIDLLYSFDAIHNRKGDVNLLSILKNEIPDNNIKYLFNNVIDILTFKEDKIKVNFLLYLIRQKNEQIICPLCVEKHKLLFKEHVTKMPVNMPMKAPKKEHRYHQLLHPSSYYFYDYLNTSDQTYWLQNYKTAKNLQDIYRELKQRDNVSFRNSFQKFNKKHKDLCIYSIKEDIEYTPKEPNVKKDSLAHCDFSFLYQTLEEHGFKQSKENHWTSQDGQTYIISIQKEETEK